MNDSVNMNENSPHTDTTVCLRAPEPTDLDALYLWENDPCQWHDSLTPPVTSRHALRRYLDACTGDIGADGSLRLIVARGDEAVGTVDLCDYDARNRTAWLSIYIDSRWRGHGIGTAALREALRLAADGCGLRILGTLVRADNGASTALFARAGFARAGCLPQWIETDGGRGRADLQIFYRKL